MLMTSQERIASRYIPSGYTEYQRVGDSVVYASVDQLHGIAYRGKSGKYDWYFRFTSPAALAEKTRLFFEKCEAIKEYTLSKRQSRKAFQTTLKPGDILNSSWGYDQTNVEFYQVLTVHNNTITVQEICQHYIEDGYLRGHTTPIPNKPATEPHWEGGVMVGRVNAPILTKRVQPGELVRINESVTAWKWDGKPEYTSSYA